MITLKNKNGIVITMEELGATITDIQIKGLHVAERGITIGRFANRISNGTFELDGVKYNVPVNEGKNTLHSGPDGFSHRVWDVKELKDNSVTFHIFSADGDQGFPGNFDMDASFTITDENQLVIRYRATCDKKTIVNITNHAYFNLNGTGLVDRHRLWIDAEQIAEMGEGLIPTGKFLPVEGTRFDFNKAKKVEGRYDDCFVIYGAGMRHAATLMGDDAKIAMDVITDQPAMQFFNTADHICLETQHFPDSPNRPEFPETTLEPGEVFDTTTIYSFSF